MLARGREKREREQIDALLVQAWYGAALQRQKRLPPLKQLLDPTYGQTKRLSPEEKAQRQAEFAELTRRMKGQKAP